MSLKLNVRGGLLVLVGMALLEGCGGSTDEADDENVAGGGATTGGEAATGGTTVKSTPSGGAAGSTTASTAAVVGHAFGEVGVTAIDTTYVRGTGTSPTETAGTCRTTTVTGTLDGKAVEQLYDGVSYGGGTVGSEWRFNAAFGSEGQAVLSSTSDNALDFSNLPVGAVLTASAATLRVPTSLPHTDGYICVAGPSSVLRNENHYATTLTGIGFLPNCARGTAVDGEIDLCLTSGDSCETALSGSIAGQTYSTSGYDYSGGSTNLDGSFGTLNIRTQIVTTSATSATLTDTWLTDTTTGNVYCAGAESFAEATLGADFMGDPTWVRQLHFRDLRLVGNCNKVTGSDTLVIRSCLVDLAF